MNKNWFKRLGRQFLRVPLSEKILFTKHLSMMVKSGMTEVESLRLLRRQVKSRSFKIILDELIADVENGQFISVSLLPFQRVFGELFVNIVKLGETSGTLSEKLEFLTEEMKKNQELRSKVRSAMIYPVIVLIATLGITGVLIFFVLPKILPIFANLGVKLPISTRILIGTANLFYNYYLYIFLGVLVLIIALFFSLRINKVRYIYHRIMLALPFVKRISIGYNMANMTRSLGILLKSGVRIVEAVQTTSNIVANLVYRKALRQVAESVRRGEPLYEYLERNPKIFPSTLSRMIEVGEKTGNLDENLKYLAEFYENEVNETAKNLSTVLEPMLLVIMGALVGFVAISIITPIYEVTQTIGR